MSDSNARRWRDNALWIGPVALFVASTAWSVLDSAFSTDTWLALAAGRQLVEQLDWSRFRETFPLRDTFSYTFHGQPWFNGNWLANLGQYWLYARLGSSAVVYATWAIAACIQALVLLAVWWRTNSWIAAWLAAAIVGIGGRDFLEPRPAIVGLFCLAAFWALICAIEGQRARTRWWPVAVLLPVLVLWSSAHGGFVLGYALLALYLAHRVAVRLGAWAGTAETRADGLQTLAIAAVLVAAIAITWTISPFGVESFAHPGRIASSTIFRTISEWHPAWSRIGSAYPPMWRFWAILGSVACGMLLLWLAGGIVARSRNRDISERTAPSWSVFDAMIVLIGVGMTLWARRFAPLLYVLSAPVVAIWILRLARPLPPQVRGFGATVLRLAALAAAVATGWLTWTHAQRELVLAFQQRPAVGLLERSRGYPALDEVLGFIGENGLRANLFTDYGYGGSVMFRAPLARVFIDGRSDQLYTERHFTTYWTLTDSRTPVDDLRRVLDETVTDAVLLQRSPGARMLHRALAYSADWAVACVNPEFTLFLRRGSAGLTRLAALVRDGAERRPAGTDASAPEVQASRAAVLLTTRLADPTPPLRMLAAAIDRDPLLGRTFYPAIARALAEYAGEAAAFDYLVGQAARVARYGGPDPASRTDLLATLAESLAGLDHAGLRSHDRSGDPSRAGLPPR